MHCCAAVVGVADAGCADACSGWIGQQQLMTQVYSLFLLTQINPGKKLHSPSGQYRYDPLSSVQHHCKPVKKKSVGQKSFKPDEDADTCYNMLQPSSNERHVVLRSNHLPQLPRKHHVGHHVGHHVAAPSGPTALPLKSKLLT